MEFIFMLTRQDRTIADVPAVLDQLKPLAGPTGLGHIGFKDVGAQWEELAALVAAIRAMGAVSYMEMVATEPEAELAAAHLAARIGVDYLMGGTQIEAVLGILAAESGGESRADAASQRTGYLPFAGIPQGHPTRLGGSPERIAEDCRRFLALGCQGCDLLAYRAEEAEPLALIRAARDAMGDTGRLVVAGSVDSPERIRAIRRAGADAFTIGSAAFDGSFSPHKGALRSQLEDVLAACTREA